MRIDRRPSNDDPLVLISIPVIIPSLVPVLIASILLCLTRRQVAIAPARLLSFAPARRRLTALVGAVFPAAARFPPVIVTVMIAIMIIVPLCVMRIALAVTVAFITMILGHCTHRERRAEN